MGKTTTISSPCYCIQVRRAANVITKLYDKVMQPLNLTVSQFALLSNIKSLQTCNKSQLAEYAGLDRTTIVRNLNVLLEKGFIEETAGTSRRNSIIKLTDLGYSAITDGMPLWRQAQREIEEKVGLANIDKLSELLACLA